MKKVDEVLNLTPSRIIKPKRELSSRIKKMLTEWAFEAHSLDPSKSAHAYYQIFLEKLREKYKQVHRGDNLTSYRAEQSYFNNEVIEV